MAHLSPRRVHKPKRRRYLCRFRDGVTRIEVDVTPKNAVGQFYLCIESRVDEHKTVYWCAALYKLQRDGTTIAVSDQSVPWGNVWLYRPDDHRIDKPRRKR